MVSTHHPIVGVWEVHAPDAPFGWHVITFAPFGIMQQSNPPAGNPGESDSAGHGVWQAGKSGGIVAKFVEFKADHKTGAHIGKGVVVLNVVVSGDTFTGLAEAYKYTTDGECVAGPLATPVTGTRLTIDAYVKNKGETEVTHIPFSAAGARAVPDPMAELFGLAAQHAVSYPQETGQPFLSLAAGAPDDALMPTELYDQLTVDILAAPGRSPLNYTMPQGVPPLRGAFAGMLTQQGVVCSAENMLITSGGMEALSIGAWLLLDPGDVVVTEGPGFAGILSVFELLGAKIVQIPCGPTGITPEALEEAIAAHKPKVVSLMPDYQNPTGAVMPLEYRKQIAALLQKYGVYALEDGAYSLLNFDGEPLPPLQSFAPERVVYATSVSKIFAPAMRIGALVAPAALVKRAEDIKSAYNMQASAMHQAVMARFLSKDGGYLGPRLQTLRTAYKKRRQAMLAALAKYFPEGSGYSWTQPSGGMFLWLTAPQDVDFDALFPQALQYGVAYVAGNKFYADQAIAPRNSARLNFASTPEGNIDEAVRRVALTLGVLSA